MTMTKSCLLVVATALVVAVVLLACADGTGVAACGMTTHNLIAERARQWFLDTNDIDAKTLIDNNIDALQGGAPYPDYLYECGSDHQAGEDTHWPPFQAAAAKYIHDNFPRPWDEHTQKLVVFMLGVTSHYIADINWHGLAQVPFGQGFLRTLGTQNYNCTGDLCDTAHTEGDAGGEFVAARDFDLDFLHEGSWYVPTEDLVKIYNYAPKWVNVTVNASAIEKCSALFKIGTFAIKEAGAIVYDAEVQPAPFLAHYYKHFYVGGIDDNAVWTSFMWNRMLKWAVDGPPTGPLPQFFGPDQEEDGRRGSNLAAEQANQLTMRPSRAYLALLSKLAPLLPEFLAESAPLDIQRKPRGVSLKLHADRVTDALRAKVLTVVSDFVADRALSGQPTEETRAKVASLKQKIGAHLSSQEQQQQQQHQEAEAGAGRGAPVPLDTTDSLGAGLGLTYNQSNAYYGKTLCVGDVNMDGIEDIVVGIPGVGGYGNPQMGLVHVYSGNTHQIPAYPLMYVIRSPVSSYERFGSSCTVGDLNSDGYNDIIIGAPSHGGKDLAQVAGNYTGRVYAFFGSEKGLSPLPNVTISTTTRWASIGAALHFTQPCNTSSLRAPSAKKAVSYLVVGSPFYGSEQDVHRGAAALFAAKTKWPADVAFEAADTLLKGLSEFSWFGHGFTSSCINGGVDPVLAVSSPGYRNALGTVGQVVVYNLASRDQLFSVSGVADRASFGHAATFSTATEGGRSLFVSAPSHGTKILTLANSEKVMAGCLFQIGAIESLSGNLTLDDVDVVSSVCGSHDFEALGWSLLASSQGNALYASAPHQRLTGSVYKFSQSKLSEANLLTSPRPVVVGSHSFGYAIAAVGGGSTLVVGEPDDNIIRIVTLA